MRKWIALLAAGFVVLGVACGGGGGTKTLKGPDGQEIKVSGSKSLPDDFPKDFPIYGGADYQGGIQSTQEGVTGFYATWQTGDSVDKVKQFYDDKFQDGPWKSTTTINSGDGNFIGVQDRDDATREGFLSITREGDKTVIGVLVGKNLSGQAQGTSTAAAGGDDTSSDEDTPTSSSDSGEETPAEESTVPAEAKLPSDYPSSRVPLPDGARVTSASSVSSDGQKLFTVTFYSKDAPDKVSDYFKDEMPKHDWQSSLTSEQDGEFFLNWSDANEESVTITVSKSDASGYASEVSMLVTAKGS